MSHIYFIKSPATNAVKIGFSSKHPKARLKSMQTGNADELELIGWFPGTMEEERRFHMQFNDYCIRGEWFRLEGDVQKCIDAFLKHYWSEFAEPVE